MSLFSFARGSDEFAGQDLFLAKPGHEDLAVRFAIAMVRDVQRAVRRLESGGEETPSRSSSINPSRQASPSSSESRADSLLRSSFAVPDQRSAAGALQTDGRVFRG